jgi:hypothetical protein
LEHAVRHEEGKPWNQRRVESFLTRSSPVAAAAGVAAAVQQVPLQGPAGRSIFYEFGDDVRYEIHIDNDNDGDVDITYAFQFRTVIELGNPLFNEVLVPMEDKHDWNHGPPANDSEYADGVLHPEPAKLLPVLYPGVFPHLGAYTKPRADLDLVDGHPVGSRTRVREPHRAGASRLVAAERGDPADFASTMSTAQVRSRPWPKAVRYLPSTCTAQTGDDADRKGDVERSVGVPPERLACLHHATRT